MIPNYLKTSTFSYLFNQQYCTVFGCFGRLDHRKDEPAFYPTRCYKYTFLANRCLKMPQYYPTTARLHFFIHLGVFVMFQKSSSGFMGRKTFDSWVEKHASLTISYQFALVGMFSYATTRNKIYGKRNN